MERRREPRIAAKERVIVTELGPGRHPHVGLIVEIAEGSLTLKLVSAIPRGTAVQVETIGMLMLGEVASCEPAEDGFRLALMLRYSLADLQALENLNRAVIGKPAPQEVPSPIPIIKE
jgi:hypothetical protein